MNRSQRIGFLEANLAQLDAILSKLPPHRVLERRGFESRRQEILKELEAISRPGTSANVILAFDGEPVADAPGIDADFAGAALIEFQDFVSIIDASKTKSVGDTGLIPDKKSSRLRVVGTVHGSFGFELQEVDNPLFASSLADSVKSATRLIAAAGQGDDEFMEAMSQADPRIQTKLGSFLKVVKNARAICKVVSDDTEAMLDKPHVEAAVERVTTTTIEDVEERHSGRFAGVTLESRWFDIEINDLGGIIKGRVHEDVDRETMAQWDRKWLNKPCIAVVRRRTVSRRNKSTATYTLLRIEPLNS